jgi:hypothetical protein
MVVNQMNIPQVHAPKAAEPALKMLTGFLESRVKGGASFKADETIQCGWMWFKIGQDHGGGLAVLAPKPGVMPMQFEPDCSAALNLVLVQKYVCDSFGVNPSLCSAAQSAIAVKDLANCKDIFMNRLEEASERSSGWFFGAADSQLDSDVADNLELKSLWELACHIPAAHEFFLLPPTWQVFFSEPPMVLRDSEPVSPKEGSYFTRKYPG